MISACRMEGGAGPSNGEFAAYPPAPQRAQLLALGQINTGQSPSRTEQKLTEFFFGKEAEPGIGLIKPVSVADTGDKLFICDSAFGAVLMWNPANRELDTPHWNEPPTRPVVVRNAPNGDILVVDIGQSVVCRYNSVGGLVKRYTSLEKFRPAGVACVNDEVWVTDSLNHRIVVFDAESAQFKRNIGRRGPGPGEFGAPLGMAVTPDGHVCVVDTLNDRIQVLDGQGNWVRDIGGPGNTIGRLGRPKDVAVGSDGTIFVSDAASQRIHVYGADGRALLAFGEPETGADALSMPAGLCICKESPLAGVSLPADFQPSYFLAVAEQLRHPGIRVYAWRGGPATLPPPVAMNANAFVDVTTSSQSPHWTSAGCIACHKMEGGKAQPIAIAATDSICLSCHDGKKARAEAHPIGRLITAGGKKPPDWPQVDGRIVCLTCHDMTGHENQSAMRPASNPIWLRGGVSTEKTSFCRNCHDEEKLARFNPHVQMDEAGHIRTQSCGICHTHTPSVPGDGIRRNSPDLRVTGSALCLGCHAKHWDVSERGHVDRPATPEIAATIERRLKENEPGAIPLWQNQVTCFSCHNPHQPGLFPQGSELGAFGSHTVDAKAHLRVDLQNLCSYCHGK